MTEISAGIRSMGLARNNAVVCSRATIIGGKIINGIFQRMRARQHLASAFRPAAVEYPCCVPSLVEDIDNCCEAVALSKLIENGDSLDQLILADHKHIDTTGHGNCDERHKSAHKSSERKKMSTIRFDSSTCQEQDQTACQRRCWACSGTIAQICSGRTQCCMMFQQHRSTLKSASSAASFLIRCSKPPASSVLDISPDAERLP